MRAMANRRWMPLVYLLFLMSMYERGIGQDAGTDLIPGVDQLLKYDQCREYLTPQNHKDAKRACRVDFDMRQTIDTTLPSQTHKDITIHLGPDMRGLVVLWRSSPFAVCSLATTPGPLARDLSPNLPTALTTVAGLGGTVSTSGLTVQSANLAGAQVVESSEPVPIELSEADRSQIIQQTMDDMNLTAQQKKDIDKLPP